MKAAAARGSRSAGSTCAQPGARGLNTQAVHGILLPHVELLLIKARRGAAQMLRIERGRHLLKAQQPVLRARVPEAKQVIGEGERQVAAFAVLTHADRAVALGERRAIRAHDQRHVPVGGRAAGPSAAQNQQLPRRIGEVILPAQRLRHAHGGIIDGIGEEERGGAIGPADHEIADVIAEEALRSVHEIHERDALPGRHAKAQRRAEPLGARAQRAARREARGRCPRSAAGARRCAARAVRAPAPARVQKHGYTAPRCSSSSK